MLPPGSTPASASARRHRRSAGPLVPIISVLALIGLLGGCSGERPTLAKAKASSSTVTSTAAATTTTVPLTNRPAGPDNMLGFIATPTGDPVVHSQPSEASAPIAIPATTPVGAPTTFAIIGDPETPATVNPGWLKVLLPTRPNGSTGWVPESSVAVTRTPFRVLIDLAGRSLRVENAGASVLEAKVAVGTAENPTPVGASYVTELIENVNPDGSYGPYAFGLALHSETLTEFAGGPGQVGVHGTNQPQLIGQPVSHGCVRLTNDDVRRLVDLQLPLGVPVFIR